MTLQTTVIGAYPKPAYLTLPDWFSNPDTPNPTAGWQEAMTALGDDAESLIGRAVEDVIADQIEAGIDIVTDGEVRRENYIHYHCRHLAGFDFEGLTNTEVRGGNYSAWLPTIRGEINATAPFLDHDFRVAQAFSRRPVKVTLPGPMTIADTIVDAYYQDPQRLGKALAGALNHEALALAKAGCRHIQVDEPVFARKPAQALAYGIENLERVFHGIDATVSRTVHMCCGYPDALDNPNYKKADRGAYAQLADAIDGIPIDWVSLEDAHRHNDLRLLEQFTKTGVVLGTVAVAKSAIETVDEIKARLQTALAHIDRERLMAAPDCGLGLLPSATAKSKLTHMCTAARGV